MALVGTHIYIHLDFDSAFYNDIFETHIFSFSKTVFEFDEHYAT